MAESTNPYEAPPPGTPRQQEAPGINPWTWALRHKIAFGLAALVVGGAMLTYSTAFYEMLFEAPEEDVAAVCADAILAESGVKPSDVTAQYVDTEAWFVQGTVRENGEAVVYQCRVSEGSFNRPSVDRVTREG